MKKQLNVNGMSCGHCVNHVRSALEEVGGVSRADVSLEERHADVTLASEVSDEALIAAVQGAGYEAQICHS